jgi:hypothetical protein
MSMLLPISLALIAFLYAMVGHGGASGYLAALALAGLPPGEVRPSALLLNIIVSGIATVQYARAGYFDRRLFAPLALASIPAAWLGGSLTIDPSLHRRVLAAALLLAAARMLMPLEERPRTGGGIRSVPAAAIGAGIGFLSGVIGIGGGILLSPLLLLRGWADAKRAAGISAPFILANSAAGLLAVLHNGATATARWDWAIVAFIGGAAGSWWGANRLPSVTLRRALGIVLIFAALKLMLS